MNVSRKSHCESFPDQKTGEKKAESRPMNSPSSTSEINKSTNIQDSWKLNLPNIQQKVSRKLPSVPSLLQTGRRFLSSIPVNEISKVRQKARRVLPCLPPVVHEILRCSIHPQEVLRGAASVSHLWNLPTIKEESLQSVHFTEKKETSTVSRVKRIVPSVPQMANRSLPSDQPNVACKPLPQFRAEFRKRMQPSLPTIKERASPIVPEVELVDGSKESLENEASLDPRLRPAEISAEKLQSIKKRKKMKQRRSKHKVGENQVSLQPAEEEAMLDLKLKTRESLENSASIMEQELPSSYSGKKSRVREHLKNDKTPLCVQQKTKCTQKSHLSVSAKQASPNLGLKAEQKRSRPPAKEQAQASCQGQGNKGLPSVYPKMNRRNPSLLSADSYEWLDHKRNESEEMLRFRAKLARRGQTLFQPSAEEKGFRPPGMTPVLSSTRSKHEQAMIPKPPLTPKRPPSARPIVRRTQLSTTNRPLPSIQTTQEPVVPKPPSTPKGPSSNRPISKRAHPNIQAHVNRPLPSIPLAKEPMVPKPPSTPKGLASARPIATRVRQNKNRPLSSSSTSQQSLVKFPLSSVHLDEKNNRSAAATVKPTMESNFQPSVEENHRRPRRNIPSNKRL